MSNKANSETLNLPKRRRTFRHQYPSWNTSPSVLARTGNMFSPGDDDDDLIDSPRSTDLPKPEGLVLQTNENGSVTLFLPTDDEYPIAGYYLYYGKDPSLLIRRKDVSSRNFVEFPAGTLDRGENTTFK